MARSPLTPFVLLAVLIASCSDTSVPATSDTGPSVGGAGGGATAGAPAAGSAGSSGTVAGAGGTGVAGTNGGAGTGGVASAGASGATTSCGDVPLDDADPCTIDACDAAIGVVTHTSRIDPSKDTLCSKTVCDPITGALSVRNLADDGNACTFDECDLAVGPVNMPKPINDGDPCTKDSCDPKLGIKHEAMEPCFLLCVSDSACEDGNPCTKDVCDPSTTFCGSTPVADGSSASDGNACNGAETCVGGVATAGVPIPIDDADPCTKDSCDPKTGKVVHAQIPGCLP